MSLKYLAGPFPFGPGVGSDNYPASPDPSFIWLDEFDGILAYDSVQNEAGVLQMDGKFTPWATTNINWGGDITNVFNVKYDAPTRRLIYTTTNLAGHPNGHDITIYRYVDWYTMEVQAQPEIQVLNFSKVPGVTLDFAYLVTLSDRVLMMGSGWRQAPLSGYRTAVFSVPYDCTLATVPVEEGEMPAGINPNDRTMRTSTPGRSVFLVQANNYGQSYSGAVEYDFIQQKVVGWTRWLGHEYDFGGSVSAPWDGSIRSYDPLRKIWWVTDEVFGIPNLWAFADEVIPFSLSNPIALAPVRSGDVVRFQVRVLGDHDEPCIGAKVDWSVSGLGELLTPQTEVDEEGYAEALVAFAPRWEGPTEESHITAEVVF